VRLSELQTRHRPALPTVLAGLITSDWRVNGVGRNVSHSFGYGLMDAGAMVKKARRWRNVPEHKVQVV
jgi:furin